MPITIVCTAAPFTGQKARTLLVPLRIDLSAASGLPAGQYSVRASYITSTSVDVFSIQMIPGAWNPTTTAPGATVSVVSPITFDPNDSVLPHYTAFPVYLDNNSITTPTTGYSASYEVAILGPAGNLIHSVPFTLTGSASPAQSVDVVFALDHGNSMKTVDASGKTRLARLNDALGRGLTLFHDYDTVGVVSFANVNCTTNPSLTPGLATESHVAAAASLGRSLVVDDSTPTTIKPIQSGVNTARAMSSTATLVLLTDGNNKNTSTSKLVQQVLPSSALIIGEDLTQFPAAVAALLVAPGGHSAFASAQTLGEFAIEKLLTQVLIGLGGTAFLNDPEGALEQGQSHTFPIRITEADRELEVIVFANDARPLDVELSDLRHGTRADHGQPHSHGNESEDHGKPDWRDGESLGHGAPPPCESREKSDLRKGIEVVRGNGVLVTRVPIPKLSEKLVYDHKVTISRPRHAARGCTAPIRYNLLVVAKTDLMLDAEVTASGLTVGSDLLFSAVLTEYGRSWVRSKPASVRVELTHPDGGVQTLTLVEVSDSPGRFQASLRSFRAGAYTAHFIATGASLLHQRPFQRECVRTVAVSLPSELCPQEDCKD